MAIIKCPECGHQINETEKICPVCGVEIAGHVVKCHVCGEVYFNDEALCPNCHSTQYTLLGTGEEKPEEEPDDKKSFYEELEEEPEDEPEEEPATPAETPAAPSAQEEGVEKNAPAEEPSVKEEEEEEEAKPAVPTREKDRKRDRKKKRYTAPVLSGKDAAADAPAQDPELPFSPAEDPEAADSAEGGEAGHSNLKRNVISFVVSIAVALLVAAISVYYYQQTKVTKENKDFERAIANNDTTMMQLFLNTYADASKAHVDTIHQRIAQIRNDEKALGVALKKRDKTSLLHYLAQHPSSKDRKAILMIVDTLDWDSTVKVNSRQAYQDYLTAHADGVFAAEAKEKLRDKELESTPADRDKMVNLFHDFFISVNAGDQEGVKRNLSSKVDRFMGTEGATTSQVVAWMQRQHGEDVSKVIWRMNRDYKIRKREVSGLVQYTVDFTAQRDIVKGGKSQTEHFRITSGVTGDGKISSMDMSTYTPQAKPAATSSSSSSASSTTKPAEKPKTSSSTAKPAEKPKTSSSTAKPAEKPKSNTSTNTVKK